MSSRVRPGPGDRVERDVAHPRDGVAEDLGAVHDELALGVGGDDRLAVGPVGAEHDRADRALAAARPGASTTAPAASANSGAVRLSS